jgi:hypothetical protein
MGVPSFIRKPKTTRRLADIASPLGDGIVNRWRQRLAEINSSQTLRRAEEDVQNVQNGRPSRHVVQIERIERIEHGAGLPTTRSPVPNSETPDQWRERLRELLSIPRPIDMPGDRWECTCRGIEQFARTWAANARNLG